MAEDGGGGRQGVLWPRMGREAGCTVAEDGGGGGVYCG